MMTISVEQNWETLRALMHTIRADADVQQLLGEGIPVLNLGSGAHPLAGAVNLDSLCSLDPDVTWDLENTPMPFMDSSFGAVCAYHVLEHIHGFVPLINDVWRVLRPGGLFHIKVPYWSGTWAVADPTHVRMFSEHTIYHFAGDNPDCRRSDSAHVGFEHSFDIERLVCHRERLSIDERERGFSPFTEMEVKLRKAL
jgi:SAM-dependent methyltransferase